MHNPESVQENETHKVVWDFKLPTDHLISTKRPDLVIDKKEKNEPATLLEDLKTVEHKSDGDANRNRCVR